MASIGATPRKPVAKTVKVRYTLSDYAKGQTADAYDANAQNWRWYIAYHWYDQTGEEPEGWAKEKDDEGNSTQRLFFVKKWTKVGRHRVSCTGKNRKTGQKEDFAEYEQQVEERGTFLARQMARSKTSFKLPNPHAELAMTWKWLTLLDGIAKVDGALPTKDLKEQHQKQVKELETYAQKLKDLLAQCDEDVIWPFRAVYLAEESMEEVDLRVFLTRPKGTKDRVMIVDWTNLNEPKMYGTYEGKFPKWEGRNTAGMISEGFKKAISTWEDDNKYWVGGIRYEFNAKLAGGSEVNESGDIKTGETGFTETLTNYLKKIALGAAMIGLILTGVGSAWAGAFIVTSMVAGTAGSVLSIHTRHSKGSGSFIDDAMDVLDIVGNVLGVGGRAGKAILWRKGATLELTAAGKTVKAMFIGEVWADGFNGMLLGVDFVKKYDEIMSISMTPDARARKLVELFGAAASAGVLHGLNHKITTAIEEAKWKRLSETTADGKPLRFDDKPTMKGNTQDGSKNVTVVSKQKRQEPAKVDATPKTTPFPPKDDKIWKRNSVNDREIDLMTNDGFHFNSHIDDDGIVTISIYTRKADNSQSPHLGTGRENFDRMFAHYKANGREVKGWQGMLVHDNFEAAKKHLPAGRKATDKEVQDAILKSVTGEKFWKPWADANGLELVFDHAIATSSFIDFKAYFKKKK